MELQFGGWPEELHLEPDQQKRFRSAQKTDVTPKAVYKEDCTALFSGSGKEPYSTTLCSCTCVDFMRRHKPCKHIYRLAMECGIIDVSFKTGVNKNDAMSLDEAVAILENYPDATQLALMPFLSGFERKGDELYFVNGQDDIAALKDCPLIEVVQTPISALLDRAKKVDMEAALRSVGIIDTKKKKKAELAKLCLDNDCETLRKMFPPLFAFRFPERVRRVLRTLYSYLLRKYEWDYYFDSDMQLLQHPHGSSEKDLVITISASTDGIKTQMNERKQDLFYFPDDHITELLTLYGHNRCLSGYNARDHIQDNISD